jgi:D-amino-acid dehydrogenase
VVGAGVIGGAVAFALAREGRRVLLFDHAPPGEGGASYGNAGHVATELVEPLPSPALLFGFWRQLFAFGGVLDVPARRLVAFAPWALRFARAAFRRRAHTELLAPFVRPSGLALVKLLADAGRPDLIRQQGHYEIWMKGNAPERARAQALAMEKLEVPTAPAPSEVLERVRLAARAEQVAGLWFPNGAHVLDPLGVVQAFVAAARKLGAEFRQHEVRSLRARGEGCELVTAAGNVQADAVVVCAGAWSAPLLEPLGFKVPLESARGYHVQSPSVTPLTDTPLVYSDRNIVVTPMAGRVRASSFMEFAGTAGPFDERKPAWLRATLRSLGYEFEPQCASWVGPRPVLPDYLPAVGRAPSAPWLYYAFAHQHIGLTLSGVTANAVADLAAGRARPDLAGFDLRRFG